MHQTTPTDDLFIVLCILAAFAALSAAIAWGQWQTHRAAQQKH